MTQKPTSALIWTVPNIVTIARMGLIPIVCVLAIMEQPTARLVATALFAIAAGTDWVDGVLARRMNQISPLGRMLDPIADKLLVGLVLLVLAWDGTLAGWSLLPALAILFREFFVSGLREYLGAEQIVVPVTQLAKWKTTIQLVSLVLLLAMPVFPAIVLPATAMLWVAALVTLWTGYEYMRGAWPHFAGSGR